MAEPGQVDLTATEMADLNLVLRRLQTVGDYLGVDRPEGGVYTAEYGESVKDALQARIGDLDNADPARLTEFSNNFTAGMQAMNMLEPLNFTGDAAGFGLYLQTVDEAVDDILPAFSAAQLNTVYNATSQAAPVQTEPQPDRVLSQAVVADNTLVQEIFAQAITNAKGEGGMTTSLIPSLLSAQGVDATNLPAMTVSEDGQWTAESLEALNGIVDMLKGPAGVEGTETGYHAGMADDFTSAFSEMDAATKTVMDAIISEEDRVRVLAALERLAQANELRPVEMVNVAPSVQVSAEEPAPVDVVEQPVVVEQPAPVVDVEQPVPAAQQPVVATREISAEVLADNQIVQERIAAAITNAQSGLVAGLLQAQGVDTSALPAMARTDGQWDAQSLSSLNGLVDMLKGPAGLSEQYPDSGYQAGMAADFRAAFTRLQQEDATKYTVLNQIISEADREALLTSLERLAAADELRPTVEAGAGPTQTGPAAAAAVAQPAISVEEATANVELTLKLFGDTLQEMAGGDGGGLAGMAANIGVDITSVFDPLTDADLNDDGFGQKSQDMAAFTIMALKRLDGQENPTGEYNAAIGENLQLSILTKPEFAQVREAMGVSFYGDAGGIDGDRAELARQLLLHERGLEEPPAGSNAAIMQQYQEQLAARQQFEQLHARELQELRTMTTFFHSMNVLEQNGQYDNEQARQTSEYNSYLRIAGDLMDQYAPGMKAWLQDFFQNSQIGQMLAGFLGMQGINVGNLWGDTNDAAAVENAAPLVGEKFDEYYAQAMEADGVDPNDHSAVIAQVRADIDEDLNGGSRVEQWLRNKGLEVVFRGVEKEDIQAAINQALDRADAAGNRADARQVFVDSMVASAEVIRVTGELDPAAVETEMQRLRADTQEFETTLEDGETLEPGHDDAAAAVVSPGDSTGADIAAETRRALEVTDAGAAPQTVVVGEQTTGYGLNYDEDMGPYPQLDRWANGRVEPIADVFERNYDTMKFSAQPVGVLAGQKYMTTEFIGFMEEAFVRAQIDTQLSGGATLDTLNLGAIDHKFDGSEDLDTVLEYMRGQGVSEADISVLAENVMSLDTDYRSPNAPGGVDHRFSVWDHSNALNAYTRDGGRVGINRDGDVFADSGQIDVALIVEEIRREVEPEPEPVPEPVETVVPEERPEPYIATVPVEEAEVPQSRFEYVPPPQQTRCAPVETFDHLARVRDEVDGRPDLNVEGELNRRIAEAFPTVSDTSAQTRTDPLKVMLEAGFARLPGTPSPGTPEYAMLDPSALGINIPGVDLVVAHRARPNGEMDIRYVNYERDGIMDINDHRPGDFRSPYNPQDTVDGNRRMDEVLLVHRRHAGNGGVFPGETNGYRHIGMVGPAGGMHGYGSTTAFNSIYNTTSGPEQHMYNEAFNIRSEVQLRTEHAINAQSHRQDDRAFDVQSCQAVMPRGQFTHAVGEPERRDIYPTTQSLGRLANTPIGAGVLQIEQLLRHGIGIRGITDNDPKNFPQSEGWQGRHPHFETMMVNQMRDLGMTNDQIEAQMEERFGRDYNVGVFR